MFFLSLVLLCLGCMATDVVELEPVAATSGTGFGSANIVCSALDETGCDSYAGCAWDSITVKCVNDPCFKWNQESSIADFVSTSPALPCKGNNPASPPIASITTHYSGLTKKPNSCTGTWTPGYPPQSPGGGSTTDFYSQKNGKSDLDECQYKYLVNQTCNDVPWCILVDAPVAAAGKVCKKLTACQATLTGTSNVIRLPTNNVCSCLNARLQAGDTTACSQNPQCYVNSANQCVNDTCYGYTIPDPENPDCSGALGGSACTVVTVLDQQGSNGQKSIPVCVQSGNSQPNKCWKLRSADSITAPPQCPVNPDVDSNGFTESLTDGYCTGECQVVTISTYYYGPKKICVDAEHLPDTGSSVVLRVPSFVAFLLVAALLSILS